MNSIIINYVLDSPYNHNSIEKLLQYCHSDNITIYLNFYDFTIDKKLSSILQDFKIGDNTIVKIFENDYEEKSNINDIILSNLIQFSDSQLMTILHDDTIINQHAIDRINFEIFNDINIGFLYSDYIINNIRCFLLSHMSGIHMNIPIIFWSMPKIIKHMSQDVFTTITSGYAGFHIPEPLFTIKSYEQK
jgi:hypothetical protein